MPNKSSVDRGKLIAYCDGFLGKRVSPEPGCSVAVFRVWEDGRKSKCVSSAKRYFAEDMRMRVRTTNEAEYFALWCALGVLNGLVLGIPAVIYSDSQLIVNQVLGRWAVGDSLAEWHARCVKKMAEYNEYNPIIVVWISRTANVKILGH